MVASKINTKELEKLLIGYPKCKKDFLIEGLKKGFHLH